MQQAFSGSVAVVGQAGRQLLHPQLTLQHQQHWYRSMTAENKQQPYCAMKQPCGLHMFSP